jgi:hypothetical protein
MLLILFIPVLAIDIIAQTDRPLPAVVKHAQPIYPPLARTARIEGDVSIKIMTDGESVKEVEVEGGHPLLRQAAEDNIRSWKFAPHDPGTFHVTFRYQLLTGDVYVQFPESSPIVRIIASPPHLFIDYAYVSLGTWDTRLISRYGESRYLLKLYFSGPDYREWLGGKVIDSKGKSDEIDSGYYKNNMFGFAVKLRQENGHRVRTFLTGKIKENSIAGAFVDDAGVTGQWIAVRKSNHSAK